MVLSTARLEALCNEMIEMARRSARRVHGEHVTPTAQEDNIRRQEIDILLGFKQRPMGTPAQQQGVRT